MVGKLMKYELRALFRVILYLGIADLVIVLIGRLLYATDPNGYLGLLLCLLGIYMSLIVMLSGVIWSIRQFYSSLFTGEGYMAFSLPVTPMQIIWSKLLSALIMSFFGALICIASCAITLTILPADTWQEIAQAFGQLFEMIRVAISSDPLVFVELILVLVVTLPMNILFFYTVICVGQLFTKGRKWITFAIGLGMLVVVLPILSTYCVDPILEAASNVSIHLSMWLSILGAAALDVGMFFLIRYIMLHRVNLIV